jgi:hypothetical protein
MKPKTAMMACFLTGLVLLIAGLRNIFAPGFFSMSPRVMSTLDLTMLFTAAAIFWLAAVGFYRRQTRQVHGLKNG